MLKASLQVFLTTDELHWDESTRPKSDSDLNSDSDSNCAACGKVESIAIIMWACWLPNKAMAKAALHLIKLQRSTVRHADMDVDVYVPHSA